jgi:hypothetical protein
MSTVVSLHIDDQTIPLHVDDTGDWLKRVETTNTIDPGRFRGESETWLVGMINTINAQVEPDLEAARQLVKQLRTSPDSVLLAQNISRLFEPGRLIYPGSPIAHQVEQTMLKDVSMGAMLRALVHNVPHIPLAKVPNRSDYVVTPTLLGAMTRAALLRDGLFGQKEKFDATYKDLQTNLDFVKQEVRQQEQSRETHAQTMAELAGRISSAWKEIEGIKTSAEAEITAFKTALQAELQLNAAYAYWNEQAIEKDESASNWLMGIGSFVLLTFGLVMAGIYRLSELKQAVSEVPFWMPTIGLVGVLGVVWIARLTSRQYTTAVHLAANFRERATFIQTYIAMLRDKDAKPEHLEIVLRAVFTSATGGLLGADHGPVTALDGLTRAISGRN